MNEDAFGLSLPETSFNRMKNQFKITLLAVLFSIGVSVVAFNILTGFIGEDKLQQNKELFIKLNTLKSVDTTFPNVIFLGSSVIYRHIDTEYLNNLAADNNCAHRFYNAGIPGMNDAEFFKFLKTLDVNQGYSPEYIVFSTLLFDPTDGDSTSRRLWLNSMSNLPINLLRLRASEVSNQEKWGFWQNFLLRQLNKGRVSVWFNMNAVQDESAQLNLTRQFEIQSLVNENAGFISLDDDPRYGLDGNRHLRFLENQEIQSLWLRRIRQSVRRVNLIKELESSDSKRALFDLYRQEILELNSQPVALYSPMQVDNDSKHYYSKMYPDLPMILPSYENEPILKEVDAWFDGGHLNATGARAFSLSAYRFFCGDFNSSP